MSSRDFADPQLFVNREQSWLDFNRRVLEQAADADWPLLERVKFLAIHAANLDEFFMVRVPGLHEQVEAGVDEPGADGYGARETLKLIRARVQEQVQLTNDIWHTELEPALAREGIRLLPWQALSPAMQQAARRYFHREVFPVLTPLTVDPLHPFPFVSNLSLSLGVEVRDPRTLETHFARVKVPESLPRFIFTHLFGLSPVGPRFESIALEELIGNNIHDLFPGAEVVAWHVFRVTRDMDLEFLEDEAADLRSVVDRELRRRRFGAPVRLEVSVGMPSSIRSFLLEKLEIESADLYEVTGLLRCSDLWELYRLARPDLKDQPFVARQPARWSPGCDPFAVIEASDVLLHHPYDSFSPVLEFLNRAAVDRDVLAVKMTLYRAGSNAEAVRALIRAAENGKQVAVSIELKARFDEENNLAWARELEKAGAHVFYGAPRLKTHAKVILVVRREGGALRRYVHLSTGNYNASTASSYTDFGLLTCDPAIGEDASQLFNSLSGFSISPEYKVLSVAPLGLRSMLMAKIDEQIERATKGLPARIFAKLNALVDPTLIRALYRASCAGVEVELLVRGICCLRPGVPGVSERISVCSLVGRFLEHERVLVVGPAGEEQCYLASADWMPRNLDRRVETLFPVTHEALRRQIIAECVEPLHVDNCRVYEMTPSGTYRRRTPLPNQKPVDAQLHTSWCSRSNRANAVPTVPPSP
ncbi:MAG TPA: polyphosphate kinase 1 [Polyangiaceae bacterium]|nr:polyphosphate kinase 1 [Polyangiaceae bacterium]